MRRFSGFRLFLTLGVLAVSSVMLLSGCSGDQGRIEEKVPGGKVKVDTENGKVEVETEKGKAEFEAGKDVELPEGFPEDFPIYENSSLVQKVKVDSEGKQGYMLVFRSKDSIKPVADWYDSKLKEGGFKTAITVQQEGIASMSFEEANGKYEGFLQITALDEGSEIALTIVFANQP